jgi:hypothetical protein
MRNFKTTFTAGAAIAVTAAIYLAGCQSSGPATATEPTGGGGVFHRMMAPPTEKAGAELWTENCTRCHNPRPPEYYSDAQWDTVVHHMRLRANLTGDEARKVAEFLKAAN